MFLGAFGFLEEPEGSKGRYVNLGPSRRQKPLSDLNRKSSLNKLLNHDYTVTLRSKENAKGHCIAEREYLRKGNLERRSSL